MREPGLTFCEPDVERFSEERLKAPLGPLGSMVKIQALKESSELSDGSNFSWSINAGSSQQKPQTEPRHVGHIWNPAP